MEKVFQLIGIVVIALTFLFPGCISQKVPIETKDSAVEEPVVHELVNIGDEIHSGIVFFVDRSGRHGLVCQTEDLGEMTWDDAMKACNDLSGGWRLPTKDELDLMYRNLHKIGLGDFAANYYWSSTEYDNISAWELYFFNGVKVNFIKASGSLVRAVREF